MPWGEAITIIKVLDRTPWTLQSSYACL